MKFFIRQTARNIVRHRKKSILHILIGVMTVLILDVYAGNMDSTEKQLTDLPNVLEVTARISTLNGSQREGMTIREDRMMGVRESEYVKDPVFTVRLKFGFGAFTVEEYKENLNYYGMGMNVPEGVSGMKREEIRGNWVPPEIILPLDYMRETYHSQGIDFYADSGSFVVKDPFQLNALKAQMHDEVKFLSVITRARHRTDGNALTIMDEAFIRSAETLSKNLALLRGMLPFLAAIVIFIGYLCSYLSLQSRREEYALLRSLGTGRGRSFFLLFGETALVEAAACLLGSLLAAVFLRPAVGVMVLSGAAFFLAFLSGAAMAILALHRLSVMEMLTKKD